MHGGEAMRTPPSILSPRNAPTLRRGKRRGRPGSAQNVRNIHLLVICGHRKFSIAQGILFDRIKRRGHFLAINGQDGLDWYARKVAVVRHVAIGSTQSIHLDRLKLLKNRGTVWIITGDPICRLKMRGVAGVLLCLITVEGFFFSSGNNLWLLGALFLSLGFSHHLRSRPHLLCRHANDHFLLPHEIDHLSRLGIENRCHLRGNVDPRFVALNLHGHLCDGTHPLHALHDGEIAKCAWDRCSTNAEDEAAQFHEQLLPSLLQKASA